jgi:hypothetical protein
MKRVKQKGLSFYVKIKKLNGEVISKQSGAKKTIWNLFEPQILGFKWIYIRVTYKPGFYNDGKYTFDQKHELLNAWRSFTEEDLIRDVINY